MQNFIILLTLVKYTSQHFLLIFVIKEADSMHKIRNNGIFKIFLRLSKGDAMVYTVLASPE